MPYFAKEKPIKQNLKKLADYSHELSQFATGLYREWNDFSWQEISEQIKELVQTAKELNQLSQQIQQEANSNE